MPRPLVPRTCPPTRVALACRHCRIKKSRCLPSRKDGVCQRCLASNIKCEFSVLVNSNSPSRSKNSSRDSRNDASAEDGQDLLSELMTEAVRTEENEDQDSIEDFHREKLARMFPSAQATSQHHFLDVGAPSNAKIPQKNRHSRILLEPKLSLGQAERYVARYRCISETYFPFVIIQASWTVHSMLKSHPMLLLSILTTMASSDPCLQFRLDREFRKVISERAFFGGEKSLDLLQGLLVFIAWYPVQLNPMSRQINQFLQMAIVMVGDLGLDNLSEENTDLKIDNIRAYLGCYYLFSTFVIPRKRHSLMEFGGYTETALDKLKKFPLNRSDSNLVEIIVLQRIAEAIRKPPLYGTNLSQGGHQEDLALREFVQSLLEQAHLTENQYPDTSYYHLITFSKSFIHVTVYSVSLAAESECPLTNTQITFMSLCIQSTRSFFEELVIMDIKEYRNFTFVEWSRVIFAVITLFRLLSKTSTSPGLDSPAVHELTQFGKYFEILCFRMHELSNASSSENEPPNIFCLWESVLRIVRAKYLQLVSDMTEQRAVNLGLKNLCPVLNGSIKETEYWEAFCQEDSSEIIANADTDKATSLPGDWIAWDTLFSMGIELDDLGEPLA